MTTLTYVAGVAKRILLGTSIIDMFFQNPVLLGKKFATLDILSDGRTIAGLEIGWSKDEYECPAFLTRYGRRDDGNQYC